MSKPRQQPYYAARCSICERHYPKVFVVVTQPRAPGSVELNVQKAHVCLTCLEILQKDNDRWPGMEAREVSQAEYNETQTTPVDA